MCLRWAFSLDVTVSSAFSSSFFSNCRLGKDIFVEIKMEAIKKTSWTHKQISLELSTTAIGVELVEKCVLITNSKSVSVFCVQSLLTKSTRLFVSNAAFVYVFVQPLFCCLTVRLLCQCFFLSFSCITFRVF